MPTLSSQQENALQQPRGQYRKFTDAISKVRKTLIQDYATRYINHCKANGGTCRRGFLAELIREAAEAAPNTAITRDDINNEVKKRNSQQGVSSSGNTHPSATFDASATNTTESSLSIVESSEGEEADTTEVQEENHDPSPNANLPAESEQPQARNKGGRPLGSTNENKRRGVWLLKDATNWVVKEYASAKTDAQEANQSSTKRVRVSNGHRTKLIEQARSKFKIDDAVKFDVPMRTIQSRTSSGNLEVYQRGPKSLVLFMEVTLKAYLIAAAVLNCAKSARESITMANDMLKGSQLQKEIIAWRKKHGLYFEGDLLLGSKWWSLFKKRNPDLELKGGQKYARNRHDHCNFPAFSRMYDNIGKQLVASGNAVAFENPVHMDFKGNIVEDENHAFGCPVTIDITRRENIFCMDETGDNTHGKNDCKKGGEKKVTVKGLIPRELVGIRDSHFTVAPVTDFNGDLRIVVLIFAAEKVPDKFCVGVDVFAKWDDDDFENNFGQGKRHPGLPLYRDDGSKVPVFFAASPNASMTGAILVKLFTAMDKLGISKRGIDKNGKPYCPVVILDGHASRLDLAFLEYMHKAKWKAVLGAPYGTAKWQLHDDLRQNGAFKMALSKAKSKLFMRKRSAYLPPEVLPCEIVIILQDAIKESFMRRDLTLKALSLRGWYPYNRNTLNDSEILQTAPEEFRKERTSILKSRFEISGDSNVVVPPTEANLLENGSGRLAGGVAASEGFARTMHDLNLTCPNAMGIVDMASKSNKQVAGRLKHMQESSTNLSHDELQQRYKEAGRCSAGVVFANGDGALDVVVMNEVARRKKVLDDVQSAKDAKAKQGRRDVIVAYKKLKLEMLEPGFKWTNDKFKIAIKCKKTAEDPKVMPTLKKDLEALWAKMATRDTPNNSDDEESIVDNGENNDAEAVGSIIAVDGSSDDDVDVDDDSVDEDDDSDDEDDESDIDDELSDDDDSETQDTDDSAFVNSAFTDRM